MSTNDPFENSTHLAPSRSDSLLRYALNAVFSYDEAGSTEPPSTFYYAKIYIEPSLVAEYASAEGDPWVTEGRNFNTGWYIIRQNSDGIVWGHYYENLIGLALDWASIQVIDAGLASDSPF